VQDFFSIDLSVLLPFIAVGFAAQLVDGALGMAFGVISSTLMISLGLPPAAASATVHVVETFTTAASAASHIFHRNVDWKLFARLVIPAMLGGALGAYVLTSISASTARPLILAYLLCIGVYIVIRGIAYPPRERTPKIIEPLGFAGGFLDAAGGGGYGPVVTSNLLVQGGSPRKVIGSVNTSEFFLTITVSATFIATLGLAAFTHATVGLLIGGLAASPFGAVIAKRVPTKPLMVLVGCVLIATSGYGIYVAVR
jgi:uncharacterized membrane protein YfcA